MSINMDRLLGLLVRTITVAFNGRYNLNMRILIECYRPCHVEGGRVHRGETADTVAIPRLEPLTSSGYTERNR